MYDELEPIRKKASHCEHDFARLGWFAAETSRDVEAIRRTAPDPFRFRDKLRAENLVRERDQ